MKNKHLLGLVAVTFATLIYGITYDVAKGIMQGFVKPYGFILIRVIGATIVFWTISLFYKSEKIEKKDYKTIALSSIFGIVINMLTFFKGLSLTTPISASTITLTTPICVLIFTTIIFRERINKTKIIGIILGLIGTIFLIVYDKKDSDYAVNENLGNTLIFLHAISFALYLMISKKLAEKYRPLTFIKWMYLIGAILVIPFGYEELEEVKWQIMPISIQLRILFVIIFSTCIAFACYIYGLTKLKPTTISVFIYLEPVIASVYSLITGSDSLSYIKITSMILIFIGVYISTKKTSIKTIKNKKLSNQNK